jgi:hypothetical protein
MLETGGARERRTSAAIEEDEQLAPRARRRPQGVLIDVGALACQARLGRRQQEAVLTACRGALTQASIGNG